MTTAQIYYSYATSIDVKASQQILADQWQKGRSGFSETEVATKTGDREDGFRTVSKNGKAIFDYRIKE